MLNEKMLIQGEMDFLEIKDWMNNLEKEFGINIVNKDEYNNLEK